MVEEWTSSKNYSDYYMHVNLFNVHTLMRYSMMFLCCNNTNWFYWWRDHSFKICYTRVLIDEKEVLIPKTRKMVSRKREFDRDLFR
jgi:hypothetical protein